MTDQEKKKEVRPLMNNWLIDWLVFNGTLTQKVPLPHGVQHWKYQSTSAGFILDPEFRSFLQYEN